MRTQVGVAQVASVKAVPAPTLLVVTPHLAHANTGNWRTAQRWARLAAPAWRPVVLHIEDRLAGTMPARLMLALHARRSRAAIAAWRANAPRRPLVVALTGTDLYRDVPAGDPDALASLRDADRLIVLQADALAHLPSELRAKARVVHQSARTLAPYAAKSPRRFNVLLVAHLREEKDPRTVLEAWRRLPHEAPATLTIVGAALDPALGEAVRVAARDDSRIRWLGPRPHAWTRQAIRRAHLVVVPSRMEGGANVVVEAVTAGTPLLASRVSGNVGMLGAGYGGYFPVGDSAALAARLAGVQRDRAALERLVAQCRTRAPLFTPHVERAALLAALAEASALEPDRR